MSNFIHKVTAAAVFGAAIVASQASAQPPASCQNMNISLYFPAYETELTPQSRKVMKEASQQLRHCVVTDISVNVLSEEAHTDEEAALLSEARADNVMQSVMDQGIDASTFKADFSRLEASAPSATPMVEPMARRVNVAFSVLPRAGV
jgi:outer membrane protein OmpA-like peptidoglycan-associated protein